MLLAVNYHFIGLPEPLTSNLNGLPKDDFIRHISWLKRHFNLVGLPEVCDAVQGKKELPPKACIITFDDGLKCHRNVVAPLMEELGFPAAFYVSAQPLDRGEATLTLKFQWVRANMPMEDIAAKAYAKLLEEGINLNGPTREQVRAHYRYDTFETARVKYILNYMLPRELSSVVICDLFSELVEDEAAWCGTMYMSRGEVRELHQKYGCIGSHAYSHSPLAELPAEKAEKEIRDSKAILEEVTGREITSIGYPLGNRMAVGPREAEFSARAGYVCGFTMERAVNQSLRNPLLFSRFDCNDIPEVGKSPLFSLQTLAEPALPESMTRNLYHREPPRTENERR